MARPRRRRRICELPKNNLFGPLKGSLANDRIIILTVDEYETIRLIDFEDLNQEECAQRMDVARTTVQGIYTIARKKIAEALVGGFTLKIEGGDYLLCEELDADLRCGRCGRGRGRGRRGILKMKIAIPMDYKDLKMNVSVSFGRAPFYAIYDIDSKTAEFIVNTAADAKGGAGIKAGQLVVDSGAKILLTPRCGENAAEVVQNAGIEIYKTENKSAEDNIADYLSGNLNLLNDIHEGFHGKGNN